MFDQLTNYSLPKWPQLMIVGEPVSIDQAKDIIFRTDASLYDPQYRGNNKTFEKWYHDISGLSKLFEHCKNSKNSKDNIDYGEWYRIFDMIQYELQFIELNFVPSSVAYGAFICGPAGFCAPNGRIFYQHNVGKWPSIEEIYEDFEKIAKAFPYLKLKASLYDGEFSEDYNSLVVSFIINNGYVILTDQNFELLKHENHPPMVANLARMLNDSGSELGLPKEWYEEQAQRIKNIIATAIG